MVEKLQAEIERLTQERDSYADQAEKFAAEIGRLSKFVGKEWSAEAADKIFANVEAKDEQIAELQAEIGRLEKIR